MCLITAIKVNKSAAKVRSDRRLIALRLLFSLKFNFMENFIKSPFGPMGLLYAELKLLKIKKQ